MRISARTIFASGLLAASSGLAFAQDGRVETQDFEGGKITITDKDDGRKEVAFDGTLLASNYFVAFEQITYIGGQPVALISVGEGGNACSPGTLFVFKNDIEVTADYVGEGCNAASPAVSADRAVFVPYLLPGETADVLSWSPEEHIQLAGRISYAPQPDTGWADFEAAELGHMLDAFKNAGIYSAAEALVGSNLTDFALSLSVGSQPEALPSGVYWASGCVPHACGVSDGFMAIDPKAKTLYLAKKAETGPPQSWPDAKTWPAEVRDAMTGTIGENK